MDKDDLRELVTALNKGLEPIIEQKVRDAVVLEVIARTRRNFLEQVDDEVARAIRESVQRLVHVTVEVRQ
jgi:hypothetical protein